MASQNELKELLSPENLMALLNSLPDVEGGEGDDEKDGDTPSSDSSVPSPYSQNNGNGDISQPIYSASAEKPAVDLNSLNDFDPFTDLNAEFKQQEDGSGAEDDDDWASAWGDDDSEEEKKKVIIRSQVGAMMNGASLSHPIRIVPLMNQFRVLQMTVALRIS